MIKWETLEKLEKNYHVSIEVGSYHDPMAGKRFDGFTVYAADGCKWDCVNGYRALVKMLAEDKVSLARLANLDYLAKAM